MVDTPDRWNPEQYERYRDERSQPFYDLLAMVEARPRMQVVDLGCGTGELTRTLHQRLGAIETLGLDSSAAMLEKSQRYAGDGLRFEQRDIADFAAEGKYDLIFSNAALHWLEAHEQLLARLTAALRTEGQLAVQVPANDDHPTHLVAAELARQSPFREAMDGYERRWPVLKPQAYAVLLYDLGYKKQSVRLQVYGHVLKAREEVIEWVKGTLLTDYEKRMSAELFTEFMRQYRERLFERIEDSRPFFYPFKRILFWAARERFS